MMYVNIQDARICVLLSIFMLISCTKNMDDKEEAIQMARNEVMYLSKQMNGHVPIHENTLVITKVKKSADSGWHVTLVQDGCAYMVYADPGHEIDVTGVSRGCFKGDQTSHP